MAQVLDFLIGHGLCIETEGQIRPGPQSTHLPSTSPLIARHHGNWRVKAMERHASLALESELAYTSPMALSRTDAVMIRETLLQSIDQVVAIVDPSPSEATYCLNIDWFEF